MSRGRTFRRWTYLVVLGCKLVQALLDDVVAIEVLDEDDNMEAQCDDDGVNLEVRLVWRVRCGLVVNLVELDDLNNGWFASPRRFFYHYRRLSRLSIFEEVCGHWP